MGAACTQASGRLHDLRERRRTLERNWAGNHVYTARSMQRPVNVEQVQHLVARAPRVRALGSRHSFNALADTEGVLVSLADVPTTVTVDVGSRAAWVTGLATYGAVALALNARGLGPWATSPRCRTSRSPVPWPPEPTARATVRAPWPRPSRASTSWVPTGTLRRVLRGDLDFAGSVVALGAVGVVVGVLLDLEPSYPVRQYVYTGLGWDQLVANFEANHRKCLQREPLHPLGRRGSVPGVAQEPRTG